MLSADQSRNGSSKSTPRTIEISYSWQQRATIFTDASSDLPLCYAKYNCGSLGMTYFRDPMSTPNHSTTPKDTVIATAKGHPFFPDCYAVLHGQHVRISAAKRMLTRYNYISRLFGADEDPEESRLMTWKSSSTLRCFDMVLLDSKQELVAQFSASYTPFGTATLKIFGTKAWQEDALDEVVVTAWTLYQTMLYRASSPVPFVGALLARRGKDYRVNGKKVEVKAIGAPELVMKA